MCAANLPESKGAVNLFFQFFLNIFWDTDFTDEHVLTSSFTISYGVFSGTRHPSLVTFFGVFAHFSTSGREESAAKPQPKRSAGLQPAWCGGWPEADDKSALHRLRKIFVVREELDILHCMHGKGFDSRRQDPDRGMGTKKCFPRLSVCRNSLVPIPLSPLAVPPGGGWPRAKPAGGTPALPLGTGTNPLRLGGLATWRWIPVESLQL